MFKEVTQPATHPSSPTESPSNSGWLDWLKAWFHFVTAYHFASPPSLEGRATPLFSREDLKESSTFEEFTAYVTKYDTHYNSLQTAIDGFDEQELSHLHSLYESLKLLNHMREQAQIWKLTHKENDFSETDTILNNNPETLKARIDQKLQAYVNGPYTARCDDLAERIQAANEEALQGFFTEIAQLKKEKEGIKTLQANLDGKGDYAEAFGRIRALYKSLYDAFPEGPQLPSEPNTAPPILRPVGLKNTGDDCFFNALLQMIFPEPKLAELIVRESKQSDFLKQAYWLYTHAQQLEQKQPLNLASFLRKSYSSIRNGQQDTHEAFNQLLDPISAKESPLAFCIEETKTYTSSDSESSSHSGTDDVSPSSSADSLSVSNESYSFCLETPFKENAAIEDLFDSYAEKEELEEREKTATTIDTFDGSVKPETVSHKFKTAPQYFFIHIKRYRTRKNIFGYTQEKISDPISIQETFYLPPSATSDGKGAKYELRSYAYHSGRTSGGHYWCNAKREGKYYSANDTTVFESRSEKFLEGAQQCHFLYAERVEATEEEIEQGIKENKEKACKMHFERVLKAVEEEKSPAEKERKLLPHFIAQLKEQNLEKLQQIYDKMPTSFKGFVEKMLKSKKVRDHLLELKDIDKEIAPNGKGKNIVEQYADLKKGPQHTDSSIEYGDFSHIKAALNQLTELESKEALLKRLKELPKDQVIDIANWTITDYGNTLKEEISDDHKLEIVIEEKLQEIQAEVQKLQELKTAWEHTRDLALKVLSEKVKKEAN